LDIQLYKGFDGNIEVSAERIKRVCDTFFSGMAPSSAQTIRYALHQAIVGLGAESLERNVNNFPWHQVTAGHFADLVSVWRNDLEDSTIRLYMQALRGITRAFFVAGMMPAEQFMLIKEVKLPRGSNRKGRGRAIEDEYCEAIFKNCGDDERIQGVRDAALFACSFGTGMRRAELASIDDENLDLDRAEVQVRAKGNNRVVKHIQAWAIPYLYEWREVRRSEGLYSGPFFTRIIKSGKLTGQRLTGRGLFYLMEQRSKMAGLPILVRPHDARRTMGTNMIKEHGELVAQRVLGHAQLSTTRIYDKRDDSVIKDIFKDKTK
tara:strand:+ start:1049 stop:2008 length:960 start_codon:yes stop_codon:yes gene_type:complete